MFLLIRAGKAKVPSFLWFQLTIYTAETLSVFNLSRCCNVVWGLCVFFTPCKWEISGYRLLDVSPENG